MKNELIRRDTAKQYREVRRILKYVNPPEPIDQASQSFPKKWLAIAVLLAALLIMCLCAGCVEAQEFSDIQNSDEEIVLAIFKAEGGNHAQYPYGIRSIRCANREEARRICINTINHDRKRYGNIRIRMGFIAYIGSRYCPTRGGRLSRAEKRLNKNWIKNVEYFLRKESSWKKQ